MAKRRNVLLAGGVTPANASASVHAAKVFFRLYGDVIRSVGVEGAL